MPVAVKMKPCLVAESFYFPRVRITSKVNQLTSNNIPENFWLRESKYELRSLVWSLKSFLACSNTLLHGDYLVRVKPSEQEASC